jgi:hypothetical protein
MNPDQFEQLEKALGAALKMQPSLRAPSALEQRVREEIARRAERPWWQRSIGEWPVAARAGFYLLSAVAAVLCVAAALAMWNGPGATLAAQLLEAFSSGRAAVDAVAGWVMGWLARLPMYGWLIIGAGVALAYAGVFGLGAAAYRLLWKAR